MATQIEELSLEIQRLFRSLSTAIQNGQAVDSNGNPVEVKAYQSQWADSAYALYDEGIQRSYSDIIEQVTTQILRIEINPANKDDADGSGLLFHDRISGYLENTFKPTVKDEIYQMILGNGDGYKGIIDTFKELQNLIGTQDGSNVTQSLLVQLTSIRGQAEEALRNIEQAKIDLAQSIDSKISDAISQMAQLNGNVQESVNQLQAKFGEMTTEYSGKISQLISKDSSLETAITTGDDAVRGEITALSGRTDDKVNGLSTRIASLEEDRTSIGTSATIKKAVDDLKSINIGDIWKLYTPVVG